jgi:hypothetical protein
MKKMVSLKGETIMNHFILVTVLVSQHVTELT